MKWLQNPPLSWDARADPPIVATGADFSGTGATALEVDLGEWR